MRARIILWTIPALVIGMAAIAAWWWFVGRAKEPIRIGVLHSLSGPMAASETPLISAYRLAIEEINARGGVLGRPLELEVRDGASDPAVFAREAERLLRDREASDLPVLAGCWTSASRKQVLPIVEQANALLLYPVQFEGMEESPNIVYLGVAPNQQIGPGIDWAMERGARRVYLVGSDYVYPHAANALLRDLVEIRGGSIVGESYLPLAGGDARAVARQIAVANPDLIVNSINGDANQGFMRALREEGIDPAMTPVLALSISESEIKAWDPALFKDVIVVGSYFRTLPNESNRRFLAKMRDQFGPELVVGDAMVSAYLGLKLWADAVKEVGSTSPDSVRRALGGTHLEGPGGIIVIDPESYYSWKVVRIGRVRADGDIDVVWDSSGAVAPRAWPMWRSRAEWRSLLDDLHRRWGGRWEAPIRRRTEPRDQAPPTPSTATSPREAAAATTATPSAPPTKPLPLPAGSGAAGPNGGGASRE